MVGEPCLADKVYYHLAPPGLSPRCFPSSGTDAGIVLRKLAACFLKSAKGRWSQRLAQGVCGEPTMLVGESLLAGDSQLNSSALTSSPCGFPLILHGKGRAHNRRPRLCKGVCPFPPLPLWGAGNGKCGSEEQGSSLCHFTSFVTLHKLFFTCSFLICKHEMVILRPQTIGTMVRAPLVGPCVMVVRIVWASPVNQGQVQIQTVRPALYHP